MALPQIHGRNIIMPHRFSCISLVAACCGLWGAVPASGFIIDPSVPDPWLSTASGSRSGNGAPATITWSFVPDLRTISTGDGGTTTSNLISFMNTNFGGTPSQTDLTKQPWFHIFSDSFGRWSQLGSVNFTYESHDDGVFHPSLNGQLGVRGDIRLAGFNIDGPSGTLAFTYIPADGSDIAIDTSEVTLFTNSLHNNVYFRNTLMHEIGHSFGLEHVNSTSNLLMAPFIDDSVNPIDGPQLDEVRGVQYFFGDPNEKSNGGLGNGTFGRATVLGGITSGSTKRIGSAANVPSQAISPAATDFVSISNAADVDYYSFTVSQPSLLSGILTPRGGVFTQADENHSPTTFDADARSNLALTVFGANGTSVLATSDANPAGGIESISNLVLPAAGTYFARVTGADDTIQLYELALSATSILLGDYNKNGVVDAGDYNVWRHTMGQSVAIGAGADGDFDGRITQADFNVWRLHFGQTGFSGAEASLAAGAGVPEPAAVLLAAMGILVLAGRVGRWESRKRLLNQRLRSSGGELRLNETVLPRAAVSVVADGQCAGRGCSRLGRHASY